MSDNPTEPATQRSRIAGCIAIAATVIVVIVLLSRLVLSVLHEEHRKVYCRHSLRLMGLGSQMYRNDFQQHLPPDLSLLYPKYVLSRANFVCPSTKDDFRGIEPGRPFLPGQCRYTYIPPRGPLDKTTTPHETTIMAHDNVGNHRRGANVVFLDGHARWMKDFVPPERTTRNEQNGAKPSGH